MHNMSLLCAVFTLLLVGVVSKEDGHEELQNFQGILRRVKRWPSCLSVSSVFNMAKGIVPCTKWCGKSNVANSSDDVTGKTDTCCRDHDLCRPNIESGDTYMDYKNTNPSSIASCDCDKAFKECLKQAQSSDPVLAYIVGNSYFNFLDNPCFDVVPATPRRCVLRFLWGCIWWNAAKPARLEINSDLSFPLLWFK